jgi:hypothetical protein
MKSLRTRSSDIPVPETSIAEAGVSRPSTARLLQAQPAADLGKLMGDFRAMVLHGACDADTAEAAAQICQALRALSIAEMEILEKAAQGMPAEAAGPGPAAENEDADPVGPTRQPACRS